MVDANIPERKTCNKCGVEKTAAEFFSDKRRKYFGAMRQPCKECTSVEVKTRRAADPEKARAQERKSWRKNFAKNGMNKRNRSRHWTLRSKFGINFYDLVEMIDAQSGQCAICRTSITAMASDKTKGDVACVDHDHSSGRIRGLLCNPCNRGIGAFSDSPGRLNAAADYLRRGVL